MSANMNGAGLTIGSILATKTRRGFLVMRGGFAGLTVIGTYAI
jgi:hypothetical protein